MPRRCKSIRDESQGIRRTCLEGESLGVGAKIVLRTSNNDEFDYLPTDFVEEDYLAYEVWQQQLAQDQKDYNETMRLAAEEANTENPLSSQASALAKIKKDTVAEKNKDKMWCSKKINLRKLRWPSLLSLSKGKEIQRRNLQGSS